MSDSEAAHRMVAMLSESSSRAEVLAAVEEYRRVWWNDGRTLSPGTLAWFVADFLPRWLAAPGDAAPDRVIRDGRGEAILNPRYVVWLEERL